MPVQWYKVELDPENQPGVVTMLELSPEQAEGFGKRAKPEQAPEKK